MYLKAEFKWEPDVDAGAEVVDVRSLAKDNGIRATMSDIATDLVGGFCPRGGNFTTNGAVPSPMALFHLDVNTSVIYDFAIRHLELRGAEISDGVRDAEERRARKRGGRDRADGGDENESPARKRSSRDSGSRSERR